MKYTIIIGIFVLVLISGCSDYQKRFIGIPLTEANDSGYQEGFDNGYDVGLMDKINFINVRIENLESFDFPYESKIMSYSYLYTDGNEVIQRSNNFIVNVSVQDKVIFIDLSKYHILEMKVAEEGSQ